MYLAAIAIKVVKAAKAMSKLDQGGVNTAGVPSGLGRGIVLSRSLGAKDMQRRRRNVETIKGLQNMVWTSASMSCQNVEPDRNYTFTPPTLMPRLRKRKQPIARVADVSPTSSTSAQSCRTVIRQFHVLLKKKRQLEQQIATGGVSPTAVSEIDMQIKELGGLEHYQQLSVLGQSQDRGGGSEKVFIKWLKELEMHRSAAKLRIVSSRHSETWFM